MQDSSSVRFSKSSKNPTPGRHFRVLAHTYMYITSRTSHQGHHITSQHHTAKQPARACCSQITGAEYAVDAEDVAGSRIMAIETDGQADEMCMVGLARNARMPAWIATAGIPGFWQAAGGRCRGRSQWKEEEEI